MTIRPASLSGISLSETMQDTRKPSQLPSSPDVKSDWEDSYDDPPQHSTQNVSELLPIGLSVKLITDYFCPSLAAGTSCLYAGHSNGVPIIFAH
ncbi:hypothetical protein AZE42_04458 [Rhizopogon vesiculosus]|uniref:Uncharacterized protein n=1 Tax=Rhizopogon vesiculosus TaxID=180088 RepID=A0A1J8R314_9AGAM|nr:hypothetical protein AZE42_04458 [Rhizopogon vesiculosus]